MNNLRPEKNLQLEINSQLKSNQILCPISHVLSAFYTFSETLAKSESLTPPMNNLTPEKKSPIRI